MTNVVKNFHKVPEKQWRKWSTQARFVFNEVYDGMVQNQWAYTHPSKEPEPLHQWTTTAWNAAWIAAGACMGNAAPLTKEIITVEPPDPTL